MKQIVSIVLVILMSVTGLSAAAGQESSKSSDDPDKTVKTIDTGLIDDNSLIEGLTIGLAKSEADLDNERLKKKAPCKAGPSDGKLLLVAGISALMGALAVIGVVFAISRIEPWPN